MLLPDGFVLPPLPYLLGLLVAALAVGYGLARRRPRVTQPHILGLVPWMALGSALHVLTVIGALPPALAPLGGTAAVYLTTAVLAGSTWLLVDAIRPNRVPHLLAGVGTLLLVPAVGLALSVGAARGTLTLAWPLGGVLLTVVVTAVGWWLLGRLRPAATATTGAVGLLALFGHTLDGISTAIGIDVLGFAERTPLSRVILGVGETLPSAEIIGSGWLFVGVKLAVAGAVVVLFRAYVEDAPTEGYALLGLLAAVGLGPGVHNLLLFAVTAGG